MSLRDWKKQKCTPLPPAKPGPPLRHPATKLPRAWGSQAMLNAPTVSHGRSRGEGEEAVIKQAHRSYQQLGIGGWVSPTATFAHPGHSSTCGSKDIDVWTFLGRSLGFGHRPLGFLQFRAVLPIGPPPGPRSLRFLTTLSWADVLGEKIMLSKASGTALRGLEWLWVCEAAGVNQRPAW
jgi:hypothetical protein